MSLLRLCMAAGSGLTLADGAFGARGIAAGRLSAEVMVADFVVNFRLPCKCIAVATRIGACAQDAGPVIDNNSAVGSHRPRPADIHQQAAVA